MEYPGDSHVFKFKLNNKGNSVLKILDIKKSCGCISLDLPNKEILSGKSEVLNLTVSQDHYGLASQYALLTTNEPNGQALHRLKVTTEIIPKFVFTPSRIVEELYPDEKSQRVIKVTIHVDAKIVSIEKSADWITSLVYNVDSGNDIIVDISAKSLKKGQYKDSIIVHTNLEKESQITIPIHLTVKPEVSVTPNFLFLGNIKKNEKTPHRFVKVSVSGKSPPRMCIAIEPPDLLSYNIKEESNGKKIYITLADLQFRGEINGQIKIQIEGTDEIKVPVKGYVH
jgi:hypothetical protein